MRAIKALSQMFTPALRAVLLKSVGLALILIIIIGIVLQRLLAALGGNRRELGRASCRGRAARSWSALAWILSIMAGFGIITGALFLMPAVTAFVGSFFVDEIADEVEREHYPADPPGRALPFFRALIEGVKTAAAGAAGLSLRAAVRAVRRPRHYHSSSWRIRICSAANISCSPPCASTRRGGQGLRKSNAVYLFLAGHVHRGVRVDPDPQSGDAAFRHGVHGAHAQEIVRPAAELIEQTR